MRVVSLIAGLFLAAIAFEDAQAVNFLGGFVDTLEADIIGVLAYSFAVLLFAGAVLAIPLARISAICFLVAGVLGIYLALDTIWSNAMILGVASLLLAWISYSSHRRQQRQQLEFDAAQEIY